MCRGTYIRHIHTHSHTQTQTQTAYKHGIPSSSTSFHRGHKHQSIETLTKLNFHCLCIVHCPLSTIHFPLFQKSIYTPRHLPTFPPSHPPQHKPHNTHPAHHPATEKRAGPNLRGQRKLPQSIHLTYRQTDKGKKKNRKKEKEESPWAPWHINLCNHRRRRRRKRKSPHPSEMPHPSLSCIVKKKKRKKPQPPNPDERGR